MALLFAIELEMSVSMAGHFFINRFLREGHSIKSQALQKLETFGRFWSFRTSRSVKSNLDIPGSSANSSVAIISFMSSQSLISSFFSRGAHLAIENVKTYFKLWQPCTIKLVKCEDAVGNWLWLCHILLQGIEDTFNSSKLGTCP